MDTLGDFLYQVRGLVAFVCVLGILWVAMLILTIQRNAERRRREKLGMEPLPNMWVSLYRWIMQKDSGSAKPAHTPRSTQTAPALDPSLTPDLDLLTGDLAEPARTAAPEPPPARAAPPEPSVEMLAETFALDDKPSAKTYAPIPASPPPPDSVELLRVFRDLLEGTLVLEIDGRRLNSVDDVLAANLERRLTKVVRDLALLVREVKDNATESAPSAPPVRVADLPPDLVELLRVFRDISEGVLIIEIDGQRFSAVDDLIAAGLSRRFTKVVRDLALLVRSVQERPVQERPAQEHSGEVPPSVPAAQPTAPVQQPPAQPLPAKPVIPLPDDEMPSMSPGTMFRQMTRAAMGQKPDMPPEENALPSLSIAEQIDELLQARLAQLPDYRGRKIKVQSSLSGGVQIRVDDQFFEGVGDVADDDVRALLQDVVREWEERYS